LLPIEAGLVGFPRVDVDADDARRLGQGQRLRGQPPSDGPVAVHGPDGRVLGLATVDPAGVLSPQRLFTWTTQAALTAAGGQ
jgi:tRNA pseudouridine55 synthase